MSIPEGKKVVMFDLDGTLAESKQPIDAEMAGLLTRLLDNAIVAMISGASLAQFQTEVLAALPLDTAHASKLFLLPTSGAALYRYDGGTWEKVYEEPFTKEEVSKIRSALIQAVRESGFGVEQTYGDTIEDRGTQVTYSGLGQVAPLDQKESWDPDQKKRQRIVALATPLLTGYTLRIGGTTSIDVTKAGIDKAYGIRRLSEHLSIEPSAMMFVGDALFSGGNDSAARKTGVEVVPVANVAETKMFITTLLS